jgi:hypothetical protein
MIDFAGMLDGYGWSDQERLAIRAAWSLWNNGGDVTGLVALFGWMHRDTWAVVREAIDLLVQ